jgi:hypothetical protein
MVSGPRSTSARATKLAALAAVAFIVSSCGGSGPVQPSRSSSLSRETSRTLAPPSATSTAAAAPTATSAPTVTSRPTVTLPRPRTPRRR